jgi:hypothetical protein
MARRRCLMVLNVLSGAQTVTDAIEEAKISRGLYYQLETKAIRAILAALLPGGEATGKGAVTWTQRMAELENKVGQLEREKRRLGRLLHVTRQLVRPGPVSMPTGRGRRRSVSTTTGASVSPSSAKAKRTEGTKALSTSITAGEVAPCAGSES